MSTIDVTATGDRFMRRIVSSHELPCPHFSIEMVGDLTPWASSPDFTCTKCNKLFSLEQALAIREMNEIRA